MQTPAGGEFVTPNAVHSDGGRRDSSSGTSWSGGGPIIATGSPRWALEAPLGTAAARAMPWQVSRAAGRRQTVAETLQRRAVPSDAQVSSLAGQLPDAERHGATPQQRIESIRGTES